MLQGPLPDDDGECEEKINRWLASARASGLPLSLDPSAGQFSMLAGAGVMKTSGFDQGKGLGETLREMFEGLLEAFPLQRRMELFSTLRSVEVPAVG